jgi:NitT/TauT family transport system ATP-binding protein
MLVYRDVEHSYQGHAGEVKALRRITMTIEKGEFVCLLGPSGCGKSSLLNMAAGFIRPETGTVEFQGAEVQGPGRERALVFQEPALMPWLTAAENILLALQVDPARRSRLPSDEELARVLELVGLKGFDRAMPHELSTGMKQKVSIARALIMGSPLLLMDEPFASLDEQTRLRLNREVTDIWLKERKTILFVTHSIQEAVVLASRIILLSARPGCIVGEWNLGRDGDEGIIRQKRRLEQPFYRDLTGEILSRMELCCPPEGSCSCREGERHEN